MNRNIIVALIVIVALIGGAYFYLNSQSRNKTPEHGGGHPTQTSNQPVVQSHRSYQIEVTSDTSNIRPNQPTAFTYKIKNDKGEILKNYEIAHEKIMHFIIVVRKDLQQFQHIHPDFNQSTGEFSVAVTFPTDGPYRVFPDFTPGVENPQKLPVTVFHDIAVGDVSKYKAQAVTTDAQSKKTFDGYQVTHNLPGNLNKQQEVNYSLNIERNSQPVTDLQTYLGALGHSVILKEETLDFIHTHAGESGTGPKIEFSTTFPESGMYKIFTQFQHQNKIITTDYVIKVN